ncbi:MAG: glycosyltransferase family 2 protein, partial [Bdellovibrionota bacterium]
MQPGRESQPIVSVIVCTHNPCADYMERTLSSLKVQTVPNEKWELLVIDNASERPVAQEIDLSWHPHARCLREEQVGLTPARLRGIRESRGELLIFIDDDNVLQPDYLEKALALQESQPFLGAFGAGVLRPEFEKEPSPKISGLLSMLALRTVDAPAWSNSPRNYETIPWGAGLCATRAVANYYLQLVEELKTVAVLDRRGDALF